MSQLNTYKVTYRAMQYGVPVPGVIVNLLLRQSVPYVLNKAFEINAQQSQTTDRDGYATFKIYTSVDLRDVVGFLDAYYILHVPDLDIYQAFWIPAADTEEFAEGDLSQLVALVEPGGDAAPPGAVAPHNHDSLYYRKVQVESLVNAEATQRLQADALQAGQISALEASVAVAMEAAEDALAHVGDSVTHTELSGETADRIAADTANANAITSEALTRATADTVNANAITSEAQTRANAITAINNALAVLGIANIAGLTAALGGKADLDESGHLAFDQIPVSLLGALRYQGSWNASTNTPHLTSSTGTKGFYYVVNVAGTTSLNGQNDWALGDHVVFNGTAWEKYDYSAVVYTSANLVATDPTNAGATAMLQAVLDNLSSALNAHTARTDNPHGVTKSQVGLGSVDNTSDALKPLSNAATTALAAKAADNAVVHLTGAETINGTKTFSSQLILSDIGADPAPSTNKIYSVGGLLRWAGKKVALIASTLTASQVVETDASGNLITAAKKSGYNLDVGTITGTLMAGDDSRALNYDLSTGFYGLLANSASTLPWKATHSFTLPLGLTNSTATSTVAATAVTVISLRKNNVQFATVTFAAGATTGTFSALAATSFTAGVDVLTAIGPATADATLANVSLGLAGVQS